MVRRKEINVTMRDFMVLQKIHEAQTHCVPIYGRFEDIQCLLNVTRLFSFSCLNE